MNWQKSDHHEQSYTHGDAIKSKPSWLVFMSYIYLMTDHILKLSKYLENSTNNMIPTLRCVTKCHTLSHISDPLKYVTTGS